MVTDGDQSPGPPRPPRGLKTPGRRLWNDVQARYELETHEELLLLEMCRTADTLDRLARQIAADGPEAGWATVEARQQRIAFARLSAALRLPAGDEGDQQAGARRTQRRSGARGVYGNLRMVQ
jgi:hypothetical protein